MIELVGNTLHVSFPEVHPDATCALSFQRTLRVPDDGSDYPLPAGLGTFPLYAVEDHPVLPAWKQHGGVFLPMHPMEAMWVNFTPWSQYPMAVKVAAGKINAITGQPWQNALDKTEQDYLVLPSQYWLDGFHVSKGQVRQFVALRHGDGHTVEEQLSGQAKWGGLQFIFYPMKAELYRTWIQWPRQIAEEVREMMALVEQRDAHGESVVDLVRLQAPRIQEIQAVLEQYAGRGEWPDVSFAVMLYQSTCTAIQSGETDGSHGACLPLPRIKSNPSRRTQEMGMAAGGRIRQEIVADAFGYEAWDAQHSSRVFVHLLPAEMMTELTGLKAPSAPMSPQDYGQANMPWFEHESEQPVLDVDILLASVLSLNESMTKAGQPLSENNSIAVATTIQIHDRRRILKDGHF